MNKIVGIQFKSSGKVYDFDPGHFVLKKGDKVMVITEQGPAIGRVCSEPQSRTRHFPERPVKKVFRLATKEEVEKYEKSCALEESVYKYCLKKIKEQALSMCLVSVERRFDGSKMVIYFTADGRVDFRELVKSLVGKFRTRIEMKQIGVRHQAKMVGGLGVCGRSLCCTMFLNQFAPVTIKMAKEQYLSLNPGKISGMCGRLMCCLTYEHGYYAELKKKFPKMNRKVETKHGKGRVVRHNVLKETVIVRLENDEELEITPQEIIERPAKKEKKKRKG